MSTIYTYDGVEIAGIVTPEVEGNWSGRPVDESRAFGILSKDSGASYLPEHEVQEIEDGIVTFRGWITSVDRSSVVPEGIKRGEKWRIVVSNIYHLLKACFVPEADTTYTQPPGLVTASDIDPGWSIGVGAMLQWALEGINALEDARVARGEPRIVPELDTSIAEVGLDPSFLVFGRYMPFMAAGQSYFGWLDAIAAMAAITWRFRDADLRLQTWSQITPPIGPYEISDKEGSAPIVAGHAVLASKDVRTTEDTAALRNKVVVAYSNGHKHLSYSSASSIALYGERVERLPLPDILTSQMARSFARRKLLTLFQPELGGDATTRYEPGIIQAMIGRRMWVRRMYHHRAGASTTNQLMTVQSGKPLYELKGEDQLTPVWIKWGFGADPWQPPAFTPFVPPRDNKIPGLDDDPGYDLPEIDDPFEDIRDLLGGGMIDPDTWHTGYQVIVADGTEIEVHGAGAYDWTALVAAEMGTDPVGITLPLGDVYGRRLWVDFYQVYNDTLHWDADPAVSNVMGSDDDTPSITSRHVYLFVWAPSFSAATPRWHLIGGGSGAGGGIDLTGYIAGDIPRFDGAALAPYSIDDETNFLDGVDADNAAAIAAETSRAEGAEALLETISDHDTDLTGKASTSHAATHEPSGSDAMAVDAAAATGSLRTIGGGALQAAAGSHGHSGFGGASGSVDTNEALAGALIGAGTYSDHFLGSGLDGAWSHEVNTPSTVLVLKSALLLIAGGVPCYTVQTDAPAGVFERECRFMATASSSNGGLVAKDTATTEAAMVAVWVDYDGASATFRLQKRTGGSTTTIATAALGVAAVQGRWIYLKLARQAADLWKAWYSWDRATYFVIGSGTFAMTVAKTGLRTASQVISFDFIDCVS